MLKDLIKQTWAEIKIDFDSTPPLEYISDEDLKYALAGIDIIKEMLSNYD